jgi:hypothetical protein
VTLPPLEHLDRLATTRQSWHAVAEHILASPRLRTDGRIGLVPTEDGFGTPVLPPDTAARVAGDTLVLTRSETSTTFPITTLRAAGDAIGIEPGAPADVYTPTTPLELDAPLLIDAADAAALAAFFCLGETALLELAASAGPDDAPSTTTLWPEHFDVGLDVGDEARDARGTFGASPGDAKHAEPYAYVTHWAELAEDPFWNDPVFGGASCTYTELAATPDADAALRDFFARGRDLLSRAPR